jgi:exosortase H (IPTLxxWG-CTERM-specific)
MKSKTLSPRADSKEVRDPSRNPVVRPMRFILLFTVSFLLGLGLLLTPPVRNADEKFTHTLVGISYGLIYICGGTADIQGAVLRSPVNGFAIEMKDGCNAVFVTVLLLSAMVAFPAPWKLKILGLLAGTIIIQCLNIIRFISLFYIGQYSLASFNFAHEYLWETLLMLDTMFLFWVWTNLVHRNRAIQNAG